MALSIEERKRKLIEDVCASCSGGGGNPSGGAADYCGDTDDFSELAKGLSMIKKSKRKRKAKDTDGS